MFLEAPRVGRHKSFLVPRLRLWLRPRLLVALLALDLLALALLAGAGVAGTIRGQVRDAVTLLPVAGVDMDLLDNNLRIDNSANGLTAADGSYVLSGIKGDFFVRADLTLAQGYADQYWPQVFLPSLAQSIRVNDTDDIAGIDFLLVTGGSISGTVIAVDTGLPLPGIDLDIRSLDGTFLASIDALTAADGSYELGLLPTGQYLVKADPTVLQGYVPLYHPFSFTQIGGTPISVTDGVVTGGVNFALEPGGEIQGTLTELGTGIGIADIDLDLFNPLFTELLDFDALSDPLGAYSFGIVPVGSYFVRADPSTAQPYDNLFFGPAVLIQQATSVVVGKGQIVSGIDIALQRQAFITGTITDAITGLPVAGIDLDLLDLLGNNLLAFDGLSTFDGSYSIGPIPAGQYLVRADATNGGVYADQYHPGVFPLSQALPVTAGSDVVAGIDFSLVRGGWIRGTITAAADGLPRKLIDLDVFTSSGEPIPSVDADSDSLGNYRLGALPPGQYILRADPLPQTGLARQYYLGVPQMAGATTVQVLVGLETTAIDFSLGEAVPTAATPAGGSSLTLLAAPHPNPFGQRSVLRLRQGSDRLIDATVYDLRGRVVRRLAVPRAAPGSEFLLQWDGRDGHGRALSSGSYFLKLRTTHGDDQVYKLSRLR